jgi:hypothetical protein
MAMYRAYLIGVSGHITRPPEIFESDDDSAAIKQAQRYVDGCDVEVWDEGRFIALVGPEGVKPKP